MDELAWFLTLRGASVWIVALALCALAGFSVGLLLERSRRKRAERVRAPEFATASDAAHYRSARRAHSPKSRRGSSSLLGLTVGVGVFLGVFVVGAQATLSLARRATARGDHLLANGSARLLPQSLLVATASPLTRGPALEELWATQSPQFGNDALSLSRIEALGPLSGHCADAVRMLYDRRQRIRSYRLAERCGLRDQYPVHASGDGFRGLIFLPFANSNAWLPSASDVAALEARVPAFFATLDSEVSPERFRGYLRQYRGRVEGGARIIDVHAFCRSDCSGHWCAAGCDGDDSCRAACSRDDLDVCVYGRHDPCDGGPCYLDFSYDVTTGRFFDFRTHGSG